MNLDSSSSQNTMIMSRPALWREVLRHRAEDFSEFYSPVTVQFSEHPGKDLGAYRQLIQSVFEEFEMRVDIEVEQDAQLTIPRLAADGELICEGVLANRDLKMAVRRSFSGW